MIAFLLGEEVVPVAPLSPPPEPGAAPVLHVETPAHHKVPVRSPVLLQPADVWRSHREILVLAASEVDSSRGGVPVRTATILAGGTATALVVHTLQHSHRQSPSGQPGDSSYRGRSPPVRTTPELPVLAAAALLAGAPGNALPVRTAAVLVGVAGTALLLGPGGRRELVWTAPVLGGDTAAALEVRPSGGGGVVRAAAKLGELTAAALVVRPLGRGQVVRAAAELRVEAAALLVGAVGRVHQVSAATPLGVLTGCRIVATFEVETLRPGETVRTAPVLCEGAVLVDLPVLVRTSLKVRAGRGTLEVRAAPELCLLTGITEEDLLGTAETSLLLGTLREGPEERIIAELLYRRYQVLFYLPSGQHPNLPA